MPPSNPSPNAADLQRAASTLPDGPNVAPSAHEHEAAQGQAQQPPQAPMGNGQDADSQPAASPGGAQATEREERIRSAAYALSARRGFAPGGDTDDWLEAERQIDAADGAARPA